MPQQVEYKIEGLEELRGLFVRTATGGMANGLHAALKGILEMLRSKVAKYPPQSAANVPPGINGYSWYERGFGTRTVTGRSYPTSQVLGKSWNTTIYGKTLDVKGVLGTPVTYSRAVQDEEQQADIHGQRGWPTVQAVVRDSRREIQEFVDKLGKKLLAPFKRGG